MNQVSIVREKHVGPFALCTSCCHVRSTYRHHSKLFDKKRNKTKQKPSRKTAWKSTSMGNMILDFNPGTWCSKIFFKARFPSRIQRAQVCQINILDSTRSRETSVCLDLNEQRKPLWLRDCKVLIHLAQHWKHSNGAKWHFSSPGGSCQHRPPLTKGKASACFSEGGANAQLASWEMQLFETSAD